MIHKIQWLSSNIVSRLTIIYSKHENRLIQVLRVLGHNEHPLHDVNALCSRRSLVRHTYSYMHGLGRESKLRFPYKVATIQHQLLIVGSLPAQNSLTTDACPTHNFQRDGTQQKVEDLQVVWQHCLSPGTRRQVGKIHVGPQVQLEAAAFGQRWVFRLLISGGWSARLRRSPWLTICFFSSTAKLVLIAGNCPPLRKSELEYYAMLSKTAVHHFAGTNESLGTAAGKLFRVGYVFLSPSNMRFCLSQICTLQCHDHLGPGRQWPSYDCRRHQRLILFILCCMVCLYIYIAQIFSGPVHNWTCMTEYQHGVTDR